MGRKKRYTDAELNTEFNRYFGIDDKSLRLKTEQMMLIRELLAGRDVCAVLPTGYGKSVIYQLAGYMMDGKVVVVSPLRSLIEDQTSKLSKQYHKRIKKSSNIEQYDKSPYYLTAEKFYYLTPESMCMAKTIKRLEDMNISMVVVDEAHCISLWGYDFRDRYMQIRSVLRLLTDSKGQRPVVGAFTATATSEIKEDIKNILGLKTRKIDIKEHFRRDDLDIILRRVPIQTKFSDYLTRTRDEYQLGKNSNRTVEQEDKYSLDTEKSDSDNIGMQRENWIYEAKLESIKEIIFEYSVKNRMDGVIFLWSATRTNLLYQYLKDEYKNYIDSNNIEIFMYTGQMDDEDRKINLKGFMRRIRNGEKDKQVRIMIATSAFGMGVDREGIGYCVHMEMPRSIEDYYQQIGRVRPDENNRSKSAPCFLLYTNPEMGDSDLESEGISTKIEEDIDYMRTGGDIDTRYSIEEDLSELRHECMKDAIRYASEEKTQRNMTDYIERYFYDFSIEEKYPILSERIKKERKQIVKQLDRAPILYGNRTLIANMVGKGFSHMDGIQLGEETYASFKLTEYVDGESYLCSDSGNASHDYSYVSGSEVKLNYLDMLVLDAVYSLYFYKNIITPDNIARVLFGTQVRMDAKRREVIADSLKRMAETFIFIEIITKKSPSNLGLQEDSDISYDYKNEKNTIEENKRIITGRVCALNLPEDRLQGEYSCSLLGSENSSMSDRLCALSPLIAMAEKRGEYYSLIEYDMRMISEKVDINSWEKLILMHYLLRRTDAYDAEKNMKNNARRDIRMMSPIIKIYDDKPDERGIETYSDTPIAYLLRGIVNYEEMTSKNYLSRRRKIYDVLDEIAKILDALTDIGRIPGWLVADKVYKDRTTSKWIDKQLSDGKPKRRVLICEGTTPKY